MMSTSFLLFSDQSCGNESFVTDLSVPSHSVRRTRVCMPSNRTVSAQPSTFSDLLEWRKNRSSRRPPSVTSETLETLDSPPAIIEPQRTAEPVPSTQYPETPFGTRPTYQGVVIFHDKPREPLWHWLCSPDGIVLCFPCWCLSCLYESTRPPQPPPTAEIVPLPPNLAQIRH